MIREEYTSKRIRESSAKIVNVCKRFFIKKITNVL